MNCKALSKLLDYFLVTAKFESVETQTGQEFGKANIKSFYYRRLEAKSSEKFRIRRHLRPLRGHLKTQRHSYEALFSLGGRFGCDDCPFRFGHF
jgi:hypothetical protein